MRKLLPILAAIPVLALAQQQPSRTPPPGAPVPGAPGAPRRGPPNIMPQQQPPAGAPGTQPPPQPPPQPAPPPPPGAGGRGTAVTTPATDGQAGNAGGAARADGHCTPMQGRFLLAFNKAEIVDVLEQASRWTCRNFAYTEDIARGKITLLSKTPVTAEEAYAAFLASLTANNIAVYPSGRYYKLIRIADAKKTPIPTLLDDGSEAPAMEQPVTKLFKLHYSSGSSRCATPPRATSPTR